MLRASNVLRNLSVAGALTATFQNLDDTILIESIGQLRPQRNLHAAGDGRRDHRCHRRPGPVPIPERGGGPGPHRRGPRALLGPRGSVKLRERRAQ